MYVRNVAATPRKTALNAPPEHHRQDFLFGQVGGPLSSIGLTEFLDRCLSDPTVRVFHMKGVV